MALPDDPKKPLWWWCDALFMAPPVLAKLSRATGDRKYLDFMDHEWWITSHLLYSPENHLFFRDQSYLDNTRPTEEASSGRAAMDRVFAGLALVPGRYAQDYPTRPKYVAQFKEMAQEIASLQGADGLWTPGTAGPGQL